jgi:hypothetical protein
MYGKVSGGEPFSTPFWISGWSGSEEHPGSFLAWEAALAPLPEREKVLKHK